MTPPEGGCGGLWGWGWGLLWSRPDPPVTNGLRLIVVLDALRSSHRNNLIAKVLGTQQLGQLLFAGRVFHYGFTVW